MNRGGRGPTPALSQTAPKDNRKPDSADIFFSQTNYARILQPLREQYERRLNKPELPEDVDRRVQKALSHYMTEVYRVNSGQMPLNSLNQEAYRETSLNIDSWLNKQVSTPTPRAQAQYVVPQQDSLFENVGSRFEREQQQRSVTQVPQATPVDFSINKGSDDEEEDPIEKYERLRKQREAESRISAVSSTTAKVKNVIESTAFSEPSAASPTSNLPPFQQNTPAPPPLLAPRPQDYIIKQEDVVKYKENELNLFVYSGDRDWLNNRNENRYNFTINFNTLNDNGNTFSPAVKERFRNIVRMELVKTIISSESLDVSVLATNNGTNTNRILNVLAYPYLMIRLSEWTGNGYGTNQYIDNTFGIVQYDQTWKSDNSAQNFGYISMTPRYLKAQRVYHPTPLATLQKLSIQVERPDGKPLTKELDILDVSKIFLAKSVIGSVYSNTPDDESYIFIKISSYFSKFFVVEGDRIIFRGYNIDTDSYVTQQMADDFNNFINKPDGHVVCGIGYTNDTSVPISIIDGANSVGYANYIVIRSRFMDPTTGSTSRNYFGGGADSTNEDLIKVRLDTNVPAGPCAILNSNRQSHFVLRLITRDMDSMSNLRPDNS
jgi:hypothetical protein